MWNGEWFKYQTSYIEFNYCFRKLSALKNIVQASQCFHSHHMKKNIAKTHPSQYSESQIRLFDILLLISTEQKMKSHAHVHRNMEHLSGHSDNGVVWGAYSHYSQTICKAMRGSWAADTRAAGGLEDGYTWAASGPFQSEWRQKKHRHRHRQSVSRQSH